MGHVAKCLRITENAYHKINNKHWHLLYWSPELTLRLVMRFEVWECLWFLLWITLSPMSSVTSRVSKENLSIGTFFTFSFKSKWKAKQTKFSCRQMKSIINRIICIKVIVTWREFPVFYRYVQLNAYCYYMNIRTHM